MATRRTTTPRRKADPGIAARTGRTIKQRPYTSAAIAAGAVTAVTAVAAAVAGLFFFRRSDKSLGQFTNDLTSRAKDGLADVSAKAKDTVTRLRDGLDQDKSQSEIAAEALTIKGTGKKSKIPADPVV